MTPTPEVKSLEIQAESRQTEMGVEVRFHSKAVNITVEIDLDEDPEFFHAMASNLVEMTIQQIAGLAGKELLGDE